MSRCPGRGSRAVAIKVLPADISVDPDRRARFEREAKAIAGLTHPHICTLHDVGGHADSMFLVMEHLDGDTLARRLERGPLSIEQALRVAIEVADALTAAHRAGIIHRDLKPGNIMLTRSGVKLLDFGLAKLTAHDEPGDVARLISAPTRTAPLIGEGLILGTLQYMAPEQLETAAVYMAGGGRCHAGRRAALLHPPQFAREVARGLPCSMCLVASSRPGAVARVGRSGRGWCTRCRCPTRVSRRASRPTAVASSSGRRETGTSGSTT